MACGNLQTAFADIGEYLNLTTRRYAPTPSPTPPVSPSF
jgi:hypothetical protein